MSGAARQNDDAPVAVQTTESAARPRLEVVRERKVLLVVHGDASKREEFENALSRNFIVLWTSSMAHALRALRNGPFDGILLELEGAGIDGYELLSLFQSHPATLGTPVICMSGGDPVKVRERVQTLGGTVLLGHPINFSKLGDDLRGILYNLNQTLHSKDGKKVFAIAYSETEKYRMIHQCIKANKDAPETLVLLSWAPGEKFLTEEEMPLVESGKLVYLEIKPSLIVKFPYLQDVSPLAYEIGLLLGDKTAGGTHLIFEDIKNIVNIYESERAIAKSYSLARLFDQNFARIMLVNTRMQKADGNMLLQKISRIFVQDALG